MSRNQVTVAAQTQDVYNKSSGRYHERFAVFEPYRTKILKFAARVSAGGTVLDLGTTVLTDAGLEPVSELTHDYAENDGSKTTDVFLEFRKTLASRRATIIGVIVLAQIPTPRDIVGVGLVMVGVAIHKVAVGD